MRLEERAEKLSEQTVKGNLSGRVKHKTVMYQETRKARILRKKQSLVGAKALERQKKIRILIFHVVLMMLCIPETNSNYTYFIILLQVSMLRQRSYFYWISLDLLNTTLSFFTKVAFEFRYYVLHRR